MNKRIGDIATDHPPITSGENAAVRVGRLDTLSDVRNELAKLYRVARQRLGNEVDVQSAAKLAYLLNCIGRSLEGYELEKRIEELERRMQSKAENK